MGATKLRCTAWCTIIIGVLLMVLACAWVPILKKLTISGAKDAAALTAENEKDWKNIPGNFDIDIHNDHYLFHCTNPDDVIYKGEKPQFEQYGPFIYREYDQYTDVSYGKTLKVNGVTDQFGSHIDNS